MEVTSLLLSGNELTGDIPPELGRLTNLSQIWLHENMLTGCVPVELANSPDVEILVDEGIAPCSSRE